MKVNELIVILNIAKEMHGNIDVYAYLDNHYGSIECVSYDNGLWLGEESRIELSKHKNNMKLITPPDLGIHVTDGVKPEIKRGE